MKKLLIYFLFIVLLSLFSNISATELKIAIIKLQEVINESNVGKRSKKILKDRFTTEEDSLKKQEKSITNLQKELEQSSLLKESAKLEKQKNLLELRRSFVNNRDIFLQKVRKAEQTYTNTILGEIETLVQKIGEKMDYDFILEQNIERFILFSKYPVVDITEEIIIEYNKL